MTEAEMDENSIGALGKRGKNHPQTNILAYPPIFIVVRESGHRLGKYAF